MVYGYFDESCKKEALDSNPRAICGLIANEETWSSFDIKWRKILDDPKWPTRAKRFHAFDCLNGSGDFWTWNSNTRLCLYADLINLIIATDVLACGVAILPFQFILLPRLVQRSFGAPDVLMMQHAIQTTITQANFRWPDAQVGIVFDRDDSILAAKAQWLYDKYTSHAKWRSWTSIDLGISEKLTMLQPSQDAVRYGV